MFVRTGDTLGSSHVIVLREATMSHWLYLCVAMALMAATTAAYAAVDLNQHGLTGSWYEPATSGQGLEVEVFPDVSAPGVGIVQVSWFTHDIVAGGAERQRWYTLSGPVATGQANAALTIYENVGGNFNAPPVTTAQAVGTATLTFDTCSSGQLAYSFTDGTRRTGTIPLTRLTQNVTCSITSARPTNADFAFSGNWYDPATAGQGLIIEVNPNSSTVFAAWFTYASNGASAGAAGQRWYTLNQPITFAPGARSIPVTLHETTGGLFDTPTVPTQKTVAVGTGVLSLQSCSAAKFSYSFTGGSSNGLSGIIALKRVGPAPASCHSPVYSGTIAEASKLDTVLQGLNAYIPSALQYNKDLLPRNPLLAAYIQAKIDILQSPTLAADIINNQFYASTSAASINGTWIPIVTIFPLSTMRSEATQAIASLEMAVPVLEDFFQIPYPTSVISLNYGFRMGSTGGGGSIDTEDQTTYETRTSSQSTLPSWLPYQSILLHELSHTYIGHESLNQFLELYVYNLVHTYSLDVKSWISTRGYVAWRTDNAGIHAVLDIYQLIGRDAMARAYRKIYALHPPYGVPLSQECKQAFVDEAPAAIKGQVSTIAAAITY